MTVLNLAILGESLRAQDSTPAVNSSRNSARTKLEKPILDEDTGATELPEVDVVAKLDAARNQILPSLGATAYDIPREQIESQSEGPNAPFNQTLLRAPGVVQDSFGQLHVRGEHANLQYRINDVLLPEGITGFGPELDSRFIDSLQLVDGALPAQYGYRTAGVVDIHSKTGVALNGGQVGVYGGSYDTIHPSLEYGGTSGALSYYFDLNYLHSDLGVENPTSSERPLHDYTDQYKGFAYLSYIIDSSSRLSFFGGTSYSDFQIPDNPNQPTGFIDRGRTDFNSALLDENQHENNDYAVLAYQKSAGALDFQAAVFERYSALLFTPDSTGDLLLNGVASRVDRSIITHGLEVDASYKLTNEHTLRGGILFTYSGQKSNDPTSVFATDSSGMQISDTPFVVQQESYKAGLLYGFYLQDEWKILPPLTINFGGRFDVVDEYDHESQLSPRVNLTLQATRSTVLHAGYARYFTPPPLENVQAGDVKKFANTTNAPETFQNDPVKAERSNYFDAGVTQTIPGGFQVGLDGYYKSSQNQLDDGQFGSALVVSPFNYRKGEIYGIELTTTYTHKGFSAYGNFAFSRAKGEDIDSAQFLFGQDELAYIKNHYIFLDHDETFAASAGASYSWDNTRLYADLIYGSGLRQGFANTQRLEAYCPLNLGIEQKIKMTAFGAFKLRFDVVNIFDQSYEIRSGSGVGVGAPQFGQRRGFYGGASFEF